MSEMLEFQGFSETGLALLASLPGLERDGFKAIRPDYERELLSPAKGFVVAVGELLKERVSDSLQAEPKVNGSLSPINNDLRFNPDKALYKDHLLFNFWEGAPKKLAPTLRIRLTADKVGFASGVVFDKVGLQKWRDALDDARGAEFATVSQRLADETSSDVAGEALKKVPAPYGQDHPRADLLRFKGYQLRWQEDLPAAVSSSAFAEWSVGRLERAAPVHRWLVELLA